MWNKVGTAVGVLAAVGAVWARFVTLEARVDFSEQIMMELASEVKGLNTSIQRLEVKLARSHCGMD